jgi:hypothetical protein
MTPEEREERLALLFNIWNERTKEQGAAVVENYGKACAAYLIELDTETDGPKLFPQASPSV